jgi:uncharacterized protein (DUF983 family)
MMGRALVRRCPWCGGRKAWFKGWFRKDERCHTCGLRWRRGQDGFETGAMTINTIATFGLLTVVLIVVTVATYPELPIVPFVISMLVAAVVVPVVLYPFSYTGWSAVDLAMHRPEPAELAEMQLFVAGRAGPAGPVAKNLATGP